jgi:hypothetical protein
MVAYGGGAEAVYILEGSEEPSWILPFELNGTSTASLIAPWVEEGRQIQKGAAVVASRRMYEAIAPVGQSIKVYAFNSSHRDELVHVLWSERSFEYKGLVWFTDRSRPCLRIDSEAIGFDKTFKAFVLEVTREKPVIGSLLGGGSSGIVVLTDDEWVAIKQRYTNLVQQIKRAGLLSRKAELESYLAGLPEDLPSVAATLEARKRYIECVNEGGDGYVPSFPSTDSRAAAQSELESVINRLDSPRCEAVTQSRGG